MWSSSRCLDLGGPSLQVTSATGFKVAANRPAQAVEDMAGAMLQVALHPELGFSMGEAGRERVRDQFPLESKGPRLTNLYEEICRRGYVATSPEP